ncbi:DUF3429 domain-containing protein [Sulfitobacter sp.]|jgi:uncharacterized protein DUF3429|uniref:DUF3429 domain-containing protein n=1 Tax=Sulfitobacter sp. TaxID=1903071 RepID=UPI000C115202|nr:DUF3429 domain-containing protein [Roseobacter sp.]MBV49720.1 DUF3429 domain-containing protein [Roseobacter sp.]PHR01308.1 MAG: DUF3429 domain-containing protein [Sulfitobacter sp.]|tara:strand:- start:1465 stop:1917 length:453 start_codon:yes stop_codon:yes gene_type:complete
MTDVPRAPLWIGLASLIPFVWGALTSANQSLALWAATTLGGRFVGPYIQLFYGAVILAFMSGILWGFATKVEGPRATTGYLLAAVPALWVFFMTGGGPVSAGFNLMFGFAGLLVLDFAFWRCGLAPDWWMKLRIPLTAIILICLGTAVFL